MKNRLFVLTLLVAGVFSVSSCGPEKIFSSSSTALPASETISNVPFSSMAGIFGLADAKSVVEDSIADLSVSSFDVGEMFAMAASQTVCQDVGTAASVFGDDRPTGSSSDDIVTLHSSISQSLESRNDQFAAEIFSSGSYLSVGMLSGRFRVSYVTTGVYFSFFEGIYTQTVVSSSSETSSSVSSKSAAVDESVVIQARDSYKNLVREYNLAFLQTCDDVVSAVLGSGGESKLTTCDHILEQSDLFLSLAGHDFASIPAAESKSLSDLSGTQASTASAMKFQSLALKPLRGDFVISGSSAYQLVHAVSSTEPLSAPVITLADYTVSLVTTLP